MPKTPLKNIKNRFLLPAGYLPILAPYPVFKYYAEMQDSNAAGFEYIYMVDQPVEKVIHSSIGGKIIGVHGPWTHLEDYPGPAIWVMNNLLYKPRVSRNLLESARKTLAFAAAVGAKYCVFHSVDFVPELPAMAKDYKMAVYMEPDPKLPGSPLWHYNHLALWEKLKLPIVFDTATPEWNGENLFDEWEKVKDHVVHIHLNEYQPHLNEDKGVLKTEKMARFLGEVKKSGYDGYFDFEIGPFQNQADKFIAALFLAACLTKMTDLFPGIQRWYAGLARKNLLDSVRFAEKYL